VGAREQESGPAADQGSEPSRSAESERPQPEVLEVVR
jgi:predicted secreted protein